METIVVRIPVVPAIELTDSVVQALQEAALVTANEASLTPVEDFHLDEVATWNSDLGERPSDMLFDYLIFKGIGTSPEPTGEDNDYSI